MRCACVIFPVCVCRAAVIIYTINAYVRISLFPCARALIWLAVIKMIKHIECCVIKTMSNLINDMLLSNVWYHRWYSRDKNHSDFKFTYSKTFHAHIIHLMNMQYLFTCKSTNNAMFYDRKKRRRREKNVKTSPGSRIRLRSIKIEINSSCLFISLWMWMQFFLFFMSFYECCSTQYTHTRTHCEILKKKPTRQQNK